MSALSTATTIPSLLQEQAQFGDHNAIVDRDQCITYADLLTRVQQTAKAYLAHGVTRGGCVAIWAPNRAEFILSMLGAQYIGAAVVPLNTRYTAREAAQLLARSRASVLTLSNGFLDRNFSQALVNIMNSPDEDTPDLTHLKLIVDIDQSSTSENCRSWSDFIADGADITDPQLTEVSAQVTPDDIVDIVFTSGTTGIPKGVMSAHRQTIGTARAWSIGADLSQDDRYAIVNPFFHGFGYKAGMISSIIAGATIYPVEVFDAKATLQLVQDEQITVLPGVPTIFTTMLDHPDRHQYDLSSLRFSVAGATAAPETLFHDMVNKLGFRRVAQAYGLTECVVATMSRPGEDLDHVAATTGPAVAETEVVIVDAQGSPLPTGEDGEIWLRGPNVMLGYFEDQAATDAAIDADGWFHTGDVGRFDEHGCVKITGRLKDMFIVGGFNVYPAEIENVLRQHPAINETAVIGIDDDRLGTVGRAYILLYRNADPRPDIQDIEHFCRERLANFKIPREFVFVDDFPRNATGKTKKSELREQAKK